MPSTKDHATTTWNSFRQATASRPGRLIGAAAAVAMLLAVMLTTLAYSGPVQAQTTSTDATLSALTVSPKDIIGFASDRTSYEVGVASTVTQATVAATANDSGATVAITPGQPVNLSAGKNTVTVTVTAQDGTTTKTYTVNVNQGVTAPFGWKAGDDLDGMIAAGNETPYAISSDGTTVWLSDIDDDKLYAYRLSDGERDTGADFDTLHAAGNRLSEGIWTDGTTMWAADPDDDKLYAYRVSDKERDTTQDFDTLKAANNDTPTGIWSDGATMWVADPGNDKIYAYRMSDKTRDASKDFDTLIAAGNEAPLGIWSDGATMWVSDFLDLTIYAYKMSDKTRDSTKDFDTLRRRGQHLAQGHLVRRRHHVGDRLHGRQGLRLQHGGQHRRRPERPHSFSQGHHWVRPRPHLLRGRHGEHRHPGHGVRDHKPRFRHSGI